MALNIPVGGISPMIGAPETGSKAKSMSGHLQSHDMAKTRPGFTDGQTIFPKGDWTAKNFLVRFFESWTTFRKDDFRLSAHAW